MDLRRLPAGLVAGVILIASGCSGDNPASFSENAMVLPATLLDAYPLAESIALDWSDGAFVTSLGGDLAVMDAQGRARNHSFEFHARFSPTQVRRLTVHLIAGIPWTQDEQISNPPLGFPDLDVIDSGDAVDAAASLADQLNAANAGTIPPAEAYAARLLSVPVWPEQSPTQTPDTVAWRVDFLEKDSNSASDPTQVWWSLARFYLDPWTGQFLGNPVLPASGREIYPFP